jgi:hypothetical protein
MTKASVSSEHHPFSVAHGTICKMIEEKQGPVAVASHSFGDMYNSLHAQALPSKLPVLEGDIMPDMALSDLELMNQFSSDTYRTLRGSDHMAAILQLGTPQLALRHKYLMRSILALAALHLSVLRPKHRDLYVYLASLHQHHALSSFRAEAKPDKVAAFMFAGFVMTYGFGMPKTPGSLGLTDSKRGAAEWVSLIRGARSLVETSHEEIAASPFKDLMYVPWYHTLLFPPEPTHDVEVDTRLKDLLYLCSSPLTPPSSTPGDSTSPRSESPVSDIDRSVVYRDTVIALQKCFHLMYTLPSTECKIGPLLCWAAILPADYLPLLSNHEPIALIILAHYCVVLTRVDVWWLDGWPTHLIDTIESLLGSTWNYWIQWPLSMIRK